MSEQEPKQIKKNNIPKNVIFIGKKPFMNYVNAAQIQLKENETIEICARGKSISRAVDISEVLEKKFMKDQIEKVEIITDSESFDSKEKEGKKINVSTIKIVLKRK